MIKEKTKGESALAFVGFWMIPLAFIIYSADKVLSLLGFDFMGWLADPGTLESFTAIVEKVVFFIGKAWFFAEPWLSPIISFLSR